jgi:GNAT superfamily N-acetyltransferase
VPFVIRPFEDRDYVRLAEISLAIDPDGARSAEWFRRRDQAWNPDHPRVRRVAEQDGRAVGWGDVGTMWWAYHPHRFSLRLNVDPAFHRQGIGSALYTALDQTLQSWQPQLVRTETRENRPHSVRFLERRGFVEVHRRWESCLVLDEARLERFAGAEQRVIQQGITITTFAAERARRGDRLVRDLFELEMLAARDEPGHDPQGAMSFEQFRANELETPEALPEAGFLALDGQRLVGVSRLMEGGAPDLLQVGFTGVDPAYRGRGIALALKLRTVEYARAHGYRAIRTQNDTTNAAMLHINAALGFVTAPAWLVYERHIAA